MTINQFVGPSHGRWLVGWDVATRRTPEFSQINDEGCLVHNKARSVRTVGSGDIRHLVGALISLGMPSAMELTLLNITERKRGVAWKTRN